MRLLFFLTIAITVLLSGHIYAQSNIPIGTWRTHFSYNQVDHVLEVKQTIYASGQNGLFIFDKDDNSITKLTKIDGLQGSTISTMQYAELADVVIIGYESGNLDLIDDHSITNFDLTSTSQIQGSKRINHITVFESFAYISTDFGVLKFDMEKREVQETYRELGLNTDGQPQALKVKMSSVLNDSLFIASEQGVLAANLVENINLLDFRNWKRYDGDDGIPAVSISVLAKKNNQLLVGIDNTGLYTYSTGEWSQTTVFQDTKFLSLHDINQPLIIADSIPYLLDELTPIEINPAIVPTVLTGIVDKSGNLWFGSLTKGLVSNFEGSFSNYLPSGPSSNKIFRLHYADNTIFGLPGGFTAGVNPINCDVGFYTFQNGNWTNFNTSGENPIPAFNDIVSAAVFNNKTYVSSIGQGLLEIDDNQATIFNESNSPLINNGSVRIPSIKSSDAGLWILNYGVNTGHLLSGPGEFQSFTISTEVGAFAKDMIVVGDQLWLIVDSSNGGGIVVADPFSGNSRHLTTASGNGGLSSTAINTLALDKDGFVWAGSDVGVSVFSNPFSALSGSVEAIEPIFENRQLLRDETVTDIEVDGGNRKWMSTLKGVWLFDAQADRQIQFFNAENSPLPSSEILDVEIQDLTGEVFFATSKGMVSWRGTSTESEIVQGNVEIFPNPVRKDFNETVGINGLTTNANVKITDISGKLIWQTKANGGTAIWRVRDYNGNRASAGVYLVFSASEDGEETMVGKIAVIN